MSEDIRNKISITHEDIVGLNFINTDCPWVFRRHFRQGLRSHVMEVLSAHDIALEKNGTLVNGTRWFPKARPRKIFRLFRSRLRHLDLALKEIARVKMVERYLAPNHMARSVEFIVDYASPHGMDLMLCGFQEYVEGMIIDPWNILDDHAFQLHLFDRLAKNITRESMHPPEWFARVQHEAAAFIDKIKTMIDETGHIPDLAGVGNLIMDRSGHIKLVDINNISRVSFDTAITLDDRNYPVCDKSIEALARLEQKILGHTIDTRDPIYRVFLEPGRLAAVKIKERLFSDCF